VNAAHPTSRVALTIRLSYDEGQSWPVAHTVYAGGSAYSSVARLASGEFGILFEKDPYGNLEFTWRSLEQVTAAADGLPAYEKWAVSHFSAAELMTPALSGSSADPDRDGLTNHDEFLAGTDPRDQLSNLKLHIRPSQTNAPKLQLNLRSNRTYTVQKTVSLDRENWDRMTDIPAISSNALVEITAVTGTNAAGFFRLVTPRMP
jgi:hypothetical protein